MSSKFVVYNTGIPVQTTSSFSDAINIANQKLNQQSLMRDYVYIHDESTDEIYQSRSSEWVNAGTLSDFVLWIAVKMQSKNENGLTIQPTPTTVVDKRQEQHSKI